MGGMLEEVHVTLSQHLISPVCICEGPRDGYGVCHMTFVGSKSPLSIGKAVLPDDERWRISSCLFFFLNYLERRTQGLLKRF